ncbi:unnamed protein product, partial [Urochloa humidicola]
GGGGGGGDGGGKAEATPAARCPPPRRHQPRHPHPTRRRARWRQPGAAAGQAAPTGWGRGGSRLRRCGSVPHAGLSGDLGERCLAVAAGGSSGRIPHLHLCPTLVLPKVNTPLSWSRWTPLTLPGRRRGSTSSSPKGQHRSCPCRPPSTATLQVNVAFRQDVAQRQCPFLVCAMRSFVLPQANSSILFCYQDANRASSRELELQLSLIFPSTAIKLSLDPRCSCEILSTEKETILSAGCSLSA